MTREEILNEIEELKEQLNIIDEEEDLCEQLKEVRKQAKLFNETKKIYEEETGMAWEQIIDMTAKINNNNK